MRILFIHNNFPAQYVHVVPALQKRGHECAAIGSDTARAMPGVRLVKYRPKRGSTKDIHPWVVRYEADVIRGQAVVEAMLALKKAGFEPDVVAGHLGWGETIFVKDVFPAAKVIVYAEYYYRAEGGDVGFDPEIGELSFEQRLRVRAKNGSLNLMTSEADLATTPTEFQKSCFPPSLLAHIVVAHDGIDTAAAAPRADASLAIPGTRLVFRPGDEVVTNLNRHLEPMRGIHRFLRALPAVLESRPKAHAVIVGSDQGSPYGGQPGGAFKTWKDKYLAEMAGRLDLSRVHFLGRVERHIYLDVLAVSACHVYLTFPFVLSWSLLESLAAGCLVVASDTAPVREAIRHGDNGMLVDFFDTAGLSAAIIRALADPAAFTAMRARARADAIARYDLETVCLPKMVDLIEGLGPAR